MVGVAPPVWVTKAKVTDVMDFLRDARFGDLFVNPTYIFRHPAIAVAVFDTILVRAVDEYGEFTALRDAGGRIELAAGSDSNLLQNFSPDCEVKVFTGH